MSSRYGCIILGRVSFCTIIVVFLLIYRHTIIKRISSFFTSYPVTQHRRLKDIQVIILYIFIYSLDIYGGSEWLRIGPTFHVTSDCPTWTPRPVIPPPLTYNTHTHNTHTQAEFFDHKSHWSVTGTLGYSKNVMVHRSKQQEYFGDVQYLLWEVFFFSF